MATFNINIQPIPPAWYTENFDMFRHENCDNLINSTHTVGTLKDGENQADRWIFSTMDTLDRYDNQTLQITNMYSTHPDSFFMEYNGVKIPNGSFEPDEPQLVIDVQFINPGIIIPGLLFRFVDHDADSGGNISFQVSMTKTPAAGGYTGLWVYPRFNSQNLQCEPPVQPQEIFQQSYDITSCETTGVYNVVVPQGSSRWVTIESNDSFGQAPIAEEIFADKQYTITVTGETGDYSVGSHSTLSTRLYSASSTVIDSVQVGRGHGGTTCS